MAMETPIDDRHEIAKPGDTAQERARRRSYGAVRTVGAWMLGAAAIIGSGGATSIDHEMSKREKETTGGNGGESVITVTVTGNNWGTGRHSDIKAVLTSAAAQMRRHLREDVEATIDVGHWEKNPETRRGVGGPTSYTIWLNAKDMYWAQYSYQFAHELCHVVANYEQRFEKPNQWFEESICETASLFTLRGMGVTWEKNPPYPTWATYAKHLSEYADNEAGNVAGQAPDDVSWEEWLRRHEEKSRADPYERVGNRIIALRMLPLFENDPEGWNAVRRLPASEVRIREFLAQWKEAADPQDREFIQRIERALRPRSKQTTQ